MDLAFSPFNENIIASASDDCTVKVSSMPSLPPSLSLLGLTRFTRHRSGTYPRAARPRISITRSSPLRGT